MAAPAHILITGASSGIGAALAKIYAVPGARLTLGGRSRERLEDVAHSCRAKGAEVAATCIDVTDREAMRAWITAADDAMALDLVIANAGISGGTGGSEAAEPAQQVRLIFDVNLNGVLNTVEPALPRMAARGRGQIALMSSLAAFSGWPGAPAYSASKGAVRLYGEALRGRMAGKGVKINVICPGFIRTPMTAVNNYPMPFLMDPDRSAKIIRAGLAKNRGRIAFPWPNYFLAGFFGLLPHCISIKLMARLPEKPGSDSAISP